MDKYELSVERRRSTGVRQADRRSWMGLLVVLGPVLLVAMDGSVLFLAIPKITTALRPTPDETLWILDIYGFIVGSLLITFGNVGDRFGRLKLLLIGTCVFGAGSLGAAFAPNAGALVGFRALMALGGATLLPSGLAVLSELFENPAQRARAIGIFAATFAAGFAVGPIAGGLLLESFWWGSVFLINIPVAILFIILAPVVLREVHGSRPGRIDIASVVMSASGLLLSIYGIKHAAAYGFSITSSVSFIVGVVVFALFLHRQRRIANPLLEVTLFRERVFTVAILTGLLSLVVWSAAAYLNSTYLQSVLGLPVFTAALCAVPGALVLTVSSVLTPRLVELIGKRHALIVCHFSMALGVLCLLLTSTTSGTVYYIASTIVAGIGFGISFSLVADTAVGAVPESRAGAAGAIAETSNEIGNALGIALLGSLVTVVFRFAYAGDEGSLGEAISGSAIGAETLNQAKRAFLQGFHVAAIVSGVMCVALGVLAIRWIPKDRVEASAGVE